MKKRRTSKRKIADKSPAHHEDDSLRVDATIDLNNLLDLNATIIIDDSSEETSTVTKPTRKRKPKKNFINDPVIAISVKEQFPHCETPNDLYTITRGLWRLDHERAGRAKYALACVDGKIKEVYEIDQWLPATKVFIDFWVARLNRQGRTISADELCDRYEFIGQLAPEEIRKKYVGRKLPKRHSGNPIMYFNG
jgi:hypothetical protein